MSGADNAAGDASDATAVNYGTTLQMLYGGPQTSELAAIQSILSNIDLAISTVNALASYEGWTTPTAVSSGAHGAKVKPPSPPFVPKKPSATWYYYVGGSAVALASLVLFYYEATKSPKAKKRRNFRKFKKS